MPETSDYSGRRFLVLGDDLQRSDLTSYKWGDCPENLNVSDFDVVILDLVPLTDKNPPELPHRSPPRPHQFYRLLFSERSEVVLLGSPKARLRYDNRHIKIRNYLPYQFGYTEEKGGQIDIIDDEFSFYFDKVSQYDYYFTGKWDVHKNANKILGRIFTKVNSHDTTIESRLAETRFHKAIGLAVSFSVSRSGSRRVPATSGPAIWLPSTDRISSTEAVELLLRERYGLRLKATPPDWLEEFVLPHEIPLCEKIEEVQKEIAELRDGLEDRRRELEVETRVKGILYERGQALEPLVRDALSSLGAEVTPAEEPGREDGRFTDPQGQQGMLEIKSSSSAIGIRDVRQLDQWVRDAIAEEDWDGKGVLVASGWVDVQPEERAEQFASNAIRTAERFGLALVSTDQVFSALQRDQEGDLDRERFWDAIMTTDGRVSLPGLSEGG